MQPIPVAALLKPRVCRRSLVGIVGSNPARGVGLSCTCCVLSCRGLWWLAQRSPTECGVSECDR